jgi:hypothetical protein
MLFAFGQASGVIWFGNDTCGSDCPDDCGDNRPCPPGCPTCACAPSTQTVPAPHINVTEPAREVRRVVYVVPAQFVTSPDPRDILHVPKRTV